jgi:hypothetical protein
MEVYHPSYHPSFVIQLLCPIAVVVAFSFFMKLELRLLIGSWYPTTNISKYHGEPTIRTFKEFKENIMWTNVFVLTVYSTTENHVIIDKQDGNNCPFVQFFWYNDTIQRDLMILLIFFSAYILLKNINREMKERKYKKYMSCMLYASQFVCLKIVYFWKAKNGALDRYLFLFVVFVITMVFIGKSFKSLYKKTNKQKREGFFIKRFIILNDLLDLLLILVASGIIVDSTVFLDNARFFGVTYDNN